MTSSPHPGVQTGGAVTTITLNSPANRNALSRHALRALRASLQDADADAAVRAVVVAAAGPVFCSGADRAELGDPVAVAELTELTEELVTQVAGMTTPVLCRVQGDAYGAGASAGGGG